MRGEASNGNLFIFEYVATTLFRCDDIGIHQCFEIADQNPDLIAENEPDADAQNDQHQYYEKNFSFAHSQVLPSLESQGVNRMIAEHPRRLQTCYALAPA